MKSSIKNSIDKKLFQRAKKLLFQRKQHFGHASKNLSKK